MKHPLRIRLILDDGFEYETYYHKSGYLECELHYLNHQLHRKNAPARINYYPSGETDYEEWYLNGKLHRTNGPAVIKRNQSGGISLKEWWVNDKLINVEKWLKENRYKWPLNKEKEIEFLLRFA